MPVKSFAVRLGVEGEADVKRGFAEQTAAAEASYSAMGAAAEQAGARTTAAVDQAAERQTRRWQQMANASRAEFARMAEQSSWSSALQAGGVLGAGPTKSAQDSAAVFAAAAAEAERYEAKALQLRAALDPLGTAQNRVNQELAEYREMARRGVISTDELALAENRLQRELAETTAAANSRTAGLSRAQLAGRLNLMRQGADVFTTAAMGMNPGMIAIQQGPQILDALRESGYKVGPAMLAAGGAVAALGASLVVAALAANSHQEAVSRMELAVLGAGRASGLTASRLYELADAGARAGDISVSAARDTAAAYLATGRVGEQTLPALIAMTRDYAVVTGQELPEAAQELAQAVTGGVQGLDQLNARFNLLSDAEYQHIRSLIEQNRLTEAQNALLPILSERIDDASNRLTGMQSALHGIKSAAENAWDALGRMIDRAMGGGTTAERIAHLYEARAGAVGRMDTAGVREFDRRIAEAQQQLRDEESDGARDRANQQDRDDRALMDRADSRGAQSRSRQNTREGLAHAIAERTALNPLDPMIGQLAQAYRALDQEQERQSDRQSGRVARQRAGARALLEDLSAQTSATWALADAWLQGDAAAMRAEAALQARGDATQRLNLMIAQAAEQGGRQIADLRSQAEAQRAANEAVDAGTMTFEDAQRQMQLDLQLRPLLIAQQNAQGEGAQRLATLIARLREEHAKLNQEQARSAVFQRVDQQEREAFVLDLERSLVGATERVRAVALARAEAERFLRDQKISESSKEGAAYLSNAEANAGRNVDIDEARFLESRRRSAADALETARVELGLVRGSADVREVILARLRAEQELRARGIDLASAEAAADLDRAETLARINLALQRQTAVWQEIGQAGSSVIDGFGDQLMRGEQSWNSWRDFGLNAIRDIANEWFRLAALNPLKNMLFGQNNPTLDDAGGVFGFFRGLLGGGGGDPIGDLIGQLGGAYAAGTSYARGGLSLVGETGPELLRLPRGARVTPANQTRSLLQGANSNRPPVHVTYAPVYHLEGTSEEIERVRALQAAQQRDFAANVATAVNQAALDGSLVYGRPAGL